MLKLTTYYIFEPLYWNALRFVCFTARRGILWRLTVDTSQYEFVLCPWIKLNRLTVLLAAGGKRW